MLVSFVLFAKHLLFSSSASTERIFLNMSSCDIYIVLFCIVLRRPRGHCSTEPLDVFVRSVALHYITIEGWIVLLVYFLSKRFYFASCQWNGGELSDMLRGSITRNIYGVSRLSLFTLIFVSPASFARNKMTEDWKWNEHTERNVTD